MLEFLGPGSFVIVKMAYFIVIHDLGPEWDHSLPMNEQKTFDEHTKFAQDLEKEHFLIMAGPIKNSSKHQILFIVNATSEEEARTKLLQDPFQQSGVLKLLEIYSWYIFVGDLTKWCYL